MGNRKVEDLIGKPFDRKFQIKKEDIDLEARTVNLSFSSEAEVERWYGIEVLEHSKSAIDLKRLNRNGPLLVNHDRNQHIGAILEAFLDEKDLKTRAKVKFSRSRLGEENFQDVQDEIKVNVSCRYNVKEIKFIETRKGEVDVYKVTKWEPLEISLEAIAADTSVGVGRKLDGLDSEASKQESVDLVDNQDDPNNGQVKIEPNLNKHIQNFEGETSSMGQRTSVNTPESQGQVPAINLESERSKILEMVAMGDKYNQKEIAAKYIQEGRGVDELGRAILDSMQSKPLSLETNTNNDLGLTAKEQRNFSFVKAIRASIDGNWKGAEFEQDVSRACESKFGRATNGFLVPYEVLRAGPNAATTNTSSNQSAIVDTTLMVDSFIDLLWNKLVTRKLGAHVLTGLVGDLAIPKQTGGATAYWIKEGEEPKGSRLATGQVPLSPKTVGAFTDLTRKLLLQSSIAIENFVRENLASIIAQALDKAVIMGSGVGAEPSGILTLLKGTDRNPNLGDDKGSFLDFKKVVHLETLVAIENADFGNLAYLTNPKVRGFLKTTKQAEGMAPFIWTNNQGIEGTVNCYKAVATNNIPSDIGTNNLSAMIFGNWSDVIIGEWGVLDVQVNPYVDNGTAGTVRIRVLQDADVAVRHIESFSAYTDLKTEEEKTIG